MQLRYGVAVAVAWASAKAWIWPLAWERPYVTDAAIKWKRKKKKKKKEEEEDI